MDNYSVHPVQLKSVKEIANHVKDLHFFPEKQKKTCLRNLCVIHLIFSNYLIAYYSNIVYILFHSVTLVA